MTFDGRDDPRYKTKMCRRMYHQEGCRHGAMCWDAHNVFELRPKVFGTRRCRRRADEEALALRRHASMTMQYSPFVPQHFCYPFISVGGWYELIVTEGDPLSTTPPRLPPLPPTTPSDKTSATASLLKDEFPPLPRAATILSLDSCVDCLDLLPHGVEKVAPPEVDVRSDTVTDQTSETDSTAPSVDMSTSPVVDCAQWNWLVITPENRQQRALSSMPAHGKALTWSTTTSSAS